jgi:hypothetical protein
MYEKFSIRNVPGEITAEKNVWVSFMARLDLQGEEQRMTKRTLKRGF